MVIGDFCSTYPNYQGWLERVKESNRLKVTQPVDKSVFFTEEKRKEKKITIAGTLESDKKGKILVVVRTDIDYPQALGQVEKTGQWSFPECTLGGVDHQIYAVFIGENDQPLFRSKVINVRLERGEQR